MSSREDLNPVALRAALVGTAFAARLHHFPTVDSTNTLLLEAAANGAPEGTVYLADEQTAGRGRGGHTWHSVARRRPLPQRARQAAPAPSRSPLDLARHRPRRTVRHHDRHRPRRRHPLAQRHPAPQLRPGKKLGGILVETAVEPGADAMLRYAVIGIGININHASFPPELAHHRHLAAPRNRPAASAATRC